MRKENIMSSNIVGQDGATAATAVATAAATAAVTIPRDTDLMSSSFRHAYHEVGTRHVVEIDVLEQLKANMAQLEDLHHRLKFMMGEISYLLKKN